MQRNKFILILLLLFVQLIYCSDLNTSSKLIEPAIVNLNAQIQTILTINSDNSGICYSTISLKDLVGRRYTYYKNVSMQGLIVSADGYIISNNAPLQSENIISDTLDSLSPVIVADIGRIEHLKKYSTMISDNELPAYKQYFFSLYNSSAGFKKILFNDYLDGGISISIYKNITVLLSKDSTPYSAQFINNSGNVMLFKIERSNLPTIELGNLTLQNNDEVVLLNPTSNRSSENLIKFNDTNYSLLKNSDLNNLDSNIITDKNGNPQAISLGDTIITKDGLNRILHDNNVKQKSSITNVEFEDALKSYNSGDQDSAKRKLRTTLQLYPEHKEAKDLLKTIEGNSVNTNSSDLISKIKEMINNIPDWAKILAELIAVVAVFLFIFNKFKEEK